MEPKFLIDGRTELFNNFYFSTISPFAPKSPYMYLQLALPQPSNDVAGARLYASGQADLNQARNLSVWISSNMEVRHVFMEVHGAWDDAQRW